MPEDQDGIAEAHHLHFTATRAHGKVSALLLRPPIATCLFVLGHGAGAGMTHRFMAAISIQLAALQVATLRYQFPFAETGRSRPDQASVLEATVRAAVAAAADVAPDLPVLAGGKSMGGRMTSQAASQKPLPGVRGLVFIGFPLHPAGKPGTGRADHLHTVDLPMLFLQGTRDRLASLDLLRPVVDHLGSRAHLHLVDGADHGFDVLKRSGRHVEDVLDELATAISDWSLKLVTS